MRALGKTRRVSANSPAVAGAEPIVTTSTPEKSSRAISSRSWSASAIMVGTEVSRVQPKRGIASR